MNERYTYEAVSNSGVGECHFRVTDTATDDRIATCYLEANAKVIVEALNAQQQLRGVANVLADRLASYEGTTVPTELGRAHRNVYFQHDPCANPNCKICGAP